MTQKHLLATADGFRVTTVGEADRSRAELALRAAGVPLPLTDLEAWHRVGPGPASILCLIHDEAARLRGAFAVQRYASNALPLHSILRVEHLGESIPDGAEPALAAALRQLARKGRRVLRLVVEIHDRDPARRARLGAALSAAGFTKRPDVRMYQHTIAIDLSLDEHALLSTFSSRARRELRRAEKLPLSVVEVDGPANAAVLDALLQETFARTGGIAPPQDWARISALALAEPQRLRQFGVMLAEEGAAPRLVAFARVIRHGTFVVYETAASTRLEDRRIPMMYPIIWAILKWAKDTGSTWFDFGGVTAGTAGTSDDPVGGISEFKRNFGGEVVEVGEDWTFDGAPVRDRLAGALSNAFAVLRRQES